MSTDLIVVAIGSRKLLRNAICVPSLTIPLVIGLVEGLVVGQHPSNTFVE